MRIDDDGVGLRDGVEGGPGFGREVGGEGEVASVGGVDVDAEVVALLEFENLVEGIDGSGGGGAEGDDDGCRCFWSGGELRGRGGRCGRCRLTEWR